jgi:hypothetical protein
MSSSRYDDSLPWCSYSFCMSGEYRGQVATVLTMARANMSTARLSKSSTS